MIARKKILQKLRKLIFLPEHDGVGKMCKFSVACTCCMKILILKFIVMRILMVKTDFKTRDANFI